MADGAGPAASRARGRRRAGSIRRDVLDAAIALFGPVAVTLASIAGAPETSAALLYVLAVAAAAYVAGRFYALLAAGLSFLAFDYLVIADNATELNHEDGASLAIFLLVAFAMTVVIVRERNLREQAQASEHRAETSAMRLRRLETVARGLLEAESPQEVLDVILSRGVVASGARAGVIGLLGDESDTIEVVASMGYDPARIDAWKRIGIHDPLPLAEAVRTQEPIFISTSAERDARYPLLADPAEQGRHSLVCLPLSFEGKPIGGLGLSFEREEHFDANRRMLNVALAALAAQALQRARLRADQQELRERLAFLSDASRLLSSSFDYESALRQIAELAVPRMAALCTVHLVSDDGTIRELATAHADTARVASLSARFTIDPDAARGVAAVVRTGEPEVTTPDEALSTGAREPRSLAEALGLGASIVVPFSARGRTHGAMTLAGRDPYSELDLELAGDLAYRAAVAIDNAELYREAERRADAARALRYVADAVVLLDSAGGVRFVNPAAVRLLSPTGDEDGSFAEGWAAVRAAVAEASPSEPTVTVPVGLRGAERWLRVSRAAFAEGTVYALHDVTDEWLLERTRSDFVATASHELRTPLAAIYGSIQTLLRDDFAFDDADREVFLTLAARECRRLNEIIDDLLLAGQLDQGQLRLTETPCDLSELVGEVVETVKVRATPAHELAVEAADVPPFACDVSRLRQVLINLVDNAVKYSPDGGRVTVRILDGENGPRIEVEDEGLGIPDDEQKLVFEKFYRLDPELSRGVGGAGLGLYITRQLVERMQGALELHSTPGRGSTFTITLPAKRVAGAAQPGGGS